MTQLTALTTLDVASNRLKKLSNVWSLPMLKSMLAADNVLESCECDPDTCSQRLESLELQHNFLNDVRR